MRSFAIASAVLVALSGAALAKDNEGSPKTESGDTKATSQDATGAAKMTQPGSPCPEKRDTAGSTPSGDADKTSNSASNQANTKC